MSTSLTCPKCNTQISTTAGNDLACCPRCGEIVSDSPSLSFQTTNSLPPPPPLLSTATLAAVNQGMSLPYGEMQQAATYLGMTRSLKGIGIGNIVWGIVLLIIGSSIGFITDLTEFAQPVKVILFSIFTFFGLAFIAEGIWLIIAPSAKGLLVAAISMFVNAFLFVNGPVLLAILVIYGITLIKRYKKYGPFMAHRPSTAMLAEAGKLLDKLQKAVRNKSPELIEFNSSDVFARRYWRGFLQDNLVVLIAFESRMIGKTIADIYFLPPSRLGIETTGKELIGKWLKGTLYVNDIKMKGTIPPECFDRFKTWKQKYLLPTG